VYVGKNGNRQHAEALWLPNRIANAKAVISDFIVGPPAVDCLTKGRRIPPNPTGVSFWNPENRCFPDRVPKTQRFSRPSVLQRYQRGINQSLQENQPVVAFGTVSRAFSVRDGRNTVAAAACIPNNAKPTLRQRDVGPNFPVCLAWQSTGGHDSPFPRNARFVRNAVAACEQH